MKEEMVRTKALQTKETAGEQMRHIFTKKSDGISAIHVVAEMGIIALLTILTIAVMRKD